MVIDIILLTHNKLENTTRCIEALYQNTSQSFRVTVIDDSTDLTPLYFKHLNKDNINYVWHEIPLTSSNQALKIGLKLTQSDPVIFLTNNTFVEPDWLNFALKIMESDEKVGLVGFKLLFPDNGTILEAGDYVSPDGLASNVGRNEPGHRYSHIREVQGIGWAVVLLRRAALTPEVLDETYYYPWRCPLDLDSCLEMKLKGWKVMYNGLGVAYHKLGTGEGVGIPHGHEEAIENCRRFRVKWAGRVPK